MKIATLTRAGGPARHRLLSAPLLHIGALSLLLAAATNLHAGATVDTLGGGPTAFNSSPAGYQDGSTAGEAQFNTPFGIAVDKLGQNLFVADRDNNAVRQIDLISGQTFTFATTSINRPVGVAVDEQGSIYVLNRGGSGAVSTTGTVLKFDPPSVGGDLVATNATGLTNAAGIALDFGGNIYVTVQSNRVIRITPAGVQTTVATITEPGASLRGLLVRRTDGRLAVCDSGRHGIYLIDPATGVVSTNSGFRGAGDFTTANNVASSTSARFNQPFGIAQAGDGSLIVADHGNHRVKVVLPSGTVTNLYGVHSNFWVSGPGTFPGWWDGTVAVPDTFGTVEARLPVGVVFAPNGTVYTTEIHYHLIRQVTGSGLPLPPPPPTPVDPPRLGWVDFTVPPSVIVSILRTGPSPNFNTFVFNNDRTIAIEGTEGTETHFTFGPTTPGSDTVPNPSPTTGSTPPLYHDGMLFNEVPRSIVPPQPDFTVKAISFQADRPSSSIIQARFIFKAASPVITGDNAAQFSVNSQTTGAEMWYTIDGSDPHPTNTPASVGPVSGPANISLNIISNTTFKIRAFRNNYLPSEIVGQTFSPTNFNANKISFGFEAGEASSEFVASPGQNFYAPVTLSILSETRMYSLQFNVTVTNLAGAPVVTPGAVGFKSFLQKPIPGTTPVIFVRIPPLSFAANFQNPPPPDKIVFDPLTGLPFVDMTFVDTNNNMNLMGVGWLERFAHTNLYDTTLQDLIKYSQPHDTLFDEDNGKVVLGGYFFSVPANATTSSVYRIEIGRPSATSDGIGAPGSDVFIATPTNGSFGPGTLTSIKHVTVGQRKYVAGDAAPFRWFNAGDFGNTNLNNSDVMQVFQSAVYQFNNPPPGSDFEDAMDSAGLALLTVPSPGVVVLETDASLYATPNDLFSGSDLDINRIAFGDGNLDVTDVYVTFRRSLDPSLNWYRRFWTPSGVRGAEIVPNEAPVAAAGEPEPSEPPVAAAGSSEAPAVIFTAGDFLVSPGQQVQVPITARIRGSYPIRTLLLNLNVRPLDGSPALTEPVQFTPAPALGLPSINSSRGLANYAGAWLNKSVSGISGTNVVGTLQFRVPATASPSAAYSIEFEHVSASPNGIASFPKQARTGLATLANRSASSWNDGISDAWRLRHFGSIYNILSDADADADGDGLSNAYESAAGTDPNDRASALRVANGDSNGRVIRWPSALGKVYVVERSASLYENWTAISTNAGTGWEMEFEDTGATGPVHFYRVRVAP